MQRPHPNPTFAHKLATLALPLAPLVRLPTGDIHPSFPSTLLSFHLLTSAQLDDLAHFYHQRSPSVYSAHYPCPVIWGRGLSIEEKRRKIGRFIGLRGCESPILSAEEVERRMWERVKREEKEKGEKEREVELWKRKLGGW